MFENFFTLVGHKNPTLFSVVRRLRPIWLPDARRHHSRRREKAQQRKGLFTQPLKHVEQKSKQSFPLTLSLF